MTATFSATVIMNEQLLRAKRRLAERVAAGVANAELARGVAKFEAQQNEQAFASEGAKSGSKWPDLLQGDGDMKGYRSWKRRNWPSQKLLVWTGKARDSLRHVGHAEHIARADGRFLEFGTRNKTIAEHMEEQSFGSTQMRLLREKTPYQPRRKNKRTGEPLKPRKWFAFRFRSIPARPGVRKSAAQVTELKKAIAREVLAMLAKDVSGPLSLNLRQAAAAVRPDPRA